MVRHDIGAAAMAVLAFGSAAPALAGLTICNETGKRQSVSIGLKTEGVWTSEGWWNLDDGECRMVVGGDLTQQYYYYRTEAKDWNFAGQGFFFCTSPQEFTIPGQDDCAARGYDREEFRAIDTGETATSYTLTVTGRKPGKSDQPAPQAAAPPPPPVFAPAAPPAPAGPAPGRHGEPYSADAIFQDCGHEDGLSYCAFHADGTKFYAYKGAGTPPSLMSAMEEIWPGVPVRVEGDLVELFDITAEVVLRSVARRAPGRNDRLLEQMQGGWYSADDPDWQFTVIGSERINSRAGVDEGVEFLSIADTCEEAPPGVGPVLLTREPGMDDIFCLGIESVGPLDMELVNFGRGNFLRFRRLD
jgi:uncharacterized membrane protein